MKRTIGAVAKALGLSAKTIRYYEDAGLIPHPDREGSSWFSAGRRVYEESEIERLRFVKEARRLEFSIEEIRKLLQSYEAGPPCGCGARPLLKTLVERKLGEIGGAIESLENLRAQMQSLYTRTLALEGKTPAELMQSGPPSVSNAVLGIRKNSA